MWFFGAVILAIGIVILMAGLSLHRRKAT
jgi:hypothetical protein